MLIDAFLTIYYVGITKAINLFPSGPDIDPLIETVENIFFLIGRLDPFLPVTEIYISLYITLFYLVGLMTVSFILWIIKTISW